MDGTLPTQAVAFDEGDIGTGLCARDCYGKRWVNESSGTAEKMLTLCASPDEYHVAQASPPASSGSVSLPGGTCGETPRELAAGTAALCALPDVQKVPPIFQRGNGTEIIGKFGGADQLRTAVNQLQSLLYAA